MNDPRYPKYRPDLQTCWPGHIEQILSDLLGPAEHFLRFPIWAGVQRTGVLRSKRFLKPIYPFTPCQSTLHLTHPILITIGCCTASSCLAPHMPDKPARPHHRTPPSTQETIAIIQNLVHVIRLLHTEYVYLETPDILNEYLGDVYLYTMMLTVYLAHAIFMIQIEVDEKPSEFERAQKSDGSRRITLT